MVIEYFKKLLSIAINNSIEIFKTQIIYLAVFYNRQQSNGRSVLSKCKQIANPFKPLN